MLTEQQITKFQAIYKARFHRDLSREEAYEQAVKLMRLVELIYKPITEVEYRELQKRRRETGDLKPNKT